LTASLKRLVSDRESELTGDRFWIVPESVNLAERQAAITFLQDTRKAHPAPSREWLSARISTLLSHYWVDGTEALTKTLVASDWIECLETLPQGAIEKAIQFWRDRETRKPKPAEIRKLAVEFFGERKWNELMRVKQIAERPVVNKETVLPAENGTEKRTDAKKAAVAALMHNAGIPHDREFCQACNGGA
jgi:hypothetical protein